MSDYTPTAEDVEVYFALGLVEYSVGNGHTISAAHDAFRRWLATHDAEKRAEWEAERGGEDVFIQRYGRFHASFGGIGGDAIRLDITREAWQAMGEPRALRASWLPVPDTTREAESKGKA